MNKCVEIGLLTLCVFLCGCDADRIAKLEKENADLKAKVEKVEKQQAASDYDLQAKCARDARTWFNQSWSHDKTTLLLDFSNHYSAAHNKCFIVVEWHYSSGLAGRVSDTSWTNDTSLWNVYENTKDAEFVENHYIDLKTNISPRDDVITCQVTGDNCKTYADFNNRAAQYVK